MGKRVAVVDDDPVVRILLTDYLATHGHEVETFSNGPECLRSLRDRLPDLLILDLMMPEMSGLDVLKEIRQDKSTTKLPVVMLSANTETESLAKSHSVWANSYVQKPFTIQQILNVVESLPQGKQPIK